MRWNTPLGPDRADTLIDLLVGDGCRSVADLGCGWAELLIRLLARCPGSHGTGVDTAGWALARGRRAAAERGVADRLELVEEDAATWAHATGARFDRLMCVGAAHAWAGAGAALAALRRLTGPGGRLLFGDGCWERSPTPAAERIFGPNVLSLGGLVAAAGHAGWRVQDLSTAGPQEWDEFESAWGRGREEWIQDYPDDPRAGAVAADLDQRRREYLDAYRGQLGFAYLVLA
jgi:SAM-dependent methyltransferase